MGLVSQIDPIPQGVAAWAKAMGATRGDVRSFRRVFSRSLMPMLLVDNDRATVDVNRAARLLARMSLDEIRARPQIDDLTSESDLPTLLWAWDRLQRFGSATGRHHTTFPDGTRLQIVYCGLANVFPARHLFVFAPADWPEDELGEVDLTGVVEASPGPLSRRELEVLTLIAAGSDLRQTAEELTIAPTTVKTHLRNALSKLGARNRPHGVAVAMHLGLIDPALAGALT
jgi:ATP/maltotriose-dependent transcriptional regulator MalT